MPSWQRTYLVACGAVIGACLAYAGCDFYGWPRLNYFPLEHRWAMLAEPAGAVGSSYLGLVLWGLGGALVAAAAMGLVTRRLAREVSARWLGLVGAWAVSGVCFSGLYFAWKEWPF